ncbi:serine/threonine protein kinase [Microcoleus sp. FACHB-1515]|uniref:serine/threonine-protein kinase n=1 Tax=Cyanophyceae TaxID=3028117 RepID=UPI0016841429|nr:serine/threonine-protein kinase [Microcoleus sp. FACHB-1515]MBD2092690.1 serine/threonine protein kinase [Microcoleus sp. FACHB-1515]
MHGSVATLSSLRSSPQHQTQLGQLCGSKQLFRDRYKIIKALGRGGFGVTFLARDATLPSAPLCVIKQLCPKVHNPVILQKACERFEREAKTLSQLGSHAQIPQLLDYFQMDGEFYLVQEYVRGSTLVKEIKNHGPQPEFAVKRFLREILPVVDYIHQNQVIHRDIKPPNIIRCQDDNRLVLIDFGAVKEQIAELGEGSQKVPTTHFVGTVGFAPPEQLALRPIYASDIYAIGVTCLYLLTGRTPMEFDYDAATGEINWQDMVQVSDHFGKILTKMIKISPRDRYQSVAQVQRALDLEAHLDNLADCMHTTRHRSIEDESAGDGYVPPISRTASAIRDWRERLELRRKRQANKPDDFSTLFTADFLGH